MKIGNKEWSSTEKSQNGLTSKADLYKALGPIIALALLDTVDDHINFVTTKKFADDNKFYAKITSEQDQKAMQNDIDNIIKWANKWGFVLNPDKCKILQFGGDTDYDFYMNNKLVENKLSAKDLGIIVDNKLNWTEQVKTTVAKARKRAYCMSRVLITLVLTIGFGKLKW